jgi:hypothetical protein
MKTLLCIIIGALLICCWAQREQIQGLRAEKQQLLDSAGNEVLVQAASAGSSPKQIENPVHTPRADLKDTPEACYAEQYHLTFDRIHDAYCYGSASALAMSFLREHPTLLKEVGHER